MVAKIRKETRPKRTKSSSPKPGPDIPLPTADALALIAANVSKGIDLDPHLAVDYALKLWQNAREKLEGEINERAPVPNDAGNIQKIDVGGLPPGFPATFEVFLNLIINDKTLADSTKRFHDFLRASSATEVEADQRMAKLEEEGFQDSESWQAAVLEYRNWRESRESQSAGPSAAPPIPPSKASLPTFGTFLRTVVKGETDADSESRFRAFLRSKFPEPEADDLMTRLSQEGFKEIGIWLKTASEFRDWCKSEK